MLPKELALVSAATIVTWDMEMLFRNLFRAVKLHVEFGGVLMDKYECSACQKLIRP
jgi:hypothetical protein